MLHELVVDGGQWEAWRARLREFLCAVLLVCALLSAPWQTLAPPSWLLGGCGFGGMSGALLTARRLHRGQLGYQPVREDWLWYVLSPLSVHAALVGVALLLLRGPVHALFGVGAILLLLLFLGLRNAWDVTTYIALQRVERSPQQRERNGRRAIRRRSAPPQRTVAQEDADERSAGGR